MELSLKEEPTRRGTRVPCAIDSVLTSVDPVRPFSAPCVIVLVNPQGCAARVRIPVEVGASVQLGRLPSGTDARARVVNCIFLGERERFWLLGLALIQPGNVWGLRTPPEDWSL
jgi:hypothetical protein